MIKHVVMIKLEGINSEEERQEMANEILNRLDKLPEKINEIIGYDTGLNIKESGTANYQDVVLLSDFNSIEEMEIYKKHPAHIESVDFIKKIGGIFTSVDYEY